MAAELRKEWGDKPCTHRNASKEYAGSTGNTGDYACTTCGDCWWGQEGWEKARAEPLAEYGGERP